MRPAACPAPTTAASSAPRPPAGAEASAGGGWRLLSVGFIESRKAINAYTTGGGTRLLEAKHDSHLVRRVKLIASTASGAAATRVSLGFGAIQSEDGERYQALLNVETELLVPGTVELWAAANGAGARVAGYMEEWYSPTPVSR